MKIGILSMQRVPNYGSFLQAYGLRSVLEKLGHEVVFIDYKEEKPAVPYRKRDRLRYKILDNKTIKHANDWIKYNILRRRNFVYKYRLSFLKQLGIGYKKKYSTAVDVAIIGSDEVFNCLQDGFNVGFSPMLFGQNVNAKKVISYAASFGNTDIDGLKKYNKSDAVAGFLCNFDAISVRDNNSKEIIKQLTGNDPELNLDPVLISDYDIPSIDLPYKDYVILYTYKSRDYSEEDKRAIIDFCELNNKTLISVGNAQTWIENRVVAEPLELLAYIKSADFIITDTFHGSVFSIKYGKRFATLIRDNNRQKLEDLLYRLHKEDRIINSFSDLQSVFEKDIDYSETRYVIDRETAHAIEYLQKNLS